MKAKFTIFELQEDFSLTVTDHQIVKGYKKNKASVILAFDFLSDSIGEHLLAKGIFHILRVNWGPETFLF